MTADPCHPRLTRGLFVFDKRAQDIGSADQPYHLALRHDRQSLQRAAIHDIEGVAERGVRADGDAGLRHDFVHAEFRQFLPPRFGRHGQQFGRANGLGAKEVPFGQDSLEFPGAVEHTRLATCTQQCAPAHQFIDDGKPIDPAFLCFFECCDRAIKEAQYPSGPNTTMGTPTP